MEDLFRMQPGIIDTEVGYAGGENDNPTYENHPGHAEALKITFDEAKTNKGIIFDYFFQIHDPTSLNRQGNDIGSSYRSAIFFEDTSDKQQAKDAIERNQKHWDKPIATTLEQLSTFWSAEEYHQDYLQKNPGGYTCHFKRKR